MKRRILRNVFVLLLTAALFSNTVCAQELGTEGSGNKEIVDTLREASEEGVDMDMGEVNEEIGEEPQLTDRANSWRYRDGQPIEDKEDNAYSQLAISSHPNSTARGIDVSQWQGTIDWEKVKAAGIGFAIIRCGYGNDMTSQDDKTFLRNVKECERLGIPYGVYLYSYARNTTMALSEANHVLRLLKGRNLSFPVYYDMEDDSTIDTDHAAIASVFCNTVAAAGYPVGVYANLYWWNNHLTNSCFGNWYRWVAQYNYQCDYWGSYAMWQYTSKGTINGIEGDCDMNFLIGKPDDHNLNGESVYQRWEYRDGYYFLKQGGEYKTGWQYVNQCWYYLSTKEGLPGGIGAMQTGWLELQKTYYLNPGGEMVTDLQFIDGVVYQFDKSGELVQKNLSGKGWIPGRGAWYYFDSNNHMSTGWKLINEKWYYFNPGGDMSTGWKNVGGYWYYLHSGGDMATGWLRYGQYWYYLNSGGDMAIGWKQLGYHWFYLNSGGDMAVGWKKIGNTWYYLNPGGDMATGWKWIGGQYYYFYPGGNMAANQWIGNDYVNASGVWVR